MTLGDIIANTDEQNQEATVFVKRVDGKFIPSSEAVIIEIDEKEQDWKIDQIANKHCPGFEYFLEIFLIKDMMDDLKGMAGYTSLQQQVERIIHYAEFDA